ncbi:MAG: type II toxin-antitoxin system HicA family toxin [Cyanobacteria bacterium J06621_8]
MSPRTPRLTAKQVIRQLKKSGFTEISQTGSHLKLFNQETRCTAIVPIHSNKIIPLGTLKAIEKQSGVKFL